MLPELQSVALRVVEPDELALSLGIRPDAYGRRLHPRFVKGGDDCVDIIDPCSSRCDLGRAHLDPLA